MQPAPHPLVDVLFEDDAVIVVNKASGMLVHRGWANDDDVLVDRVHAHTGVFVHPIHRLDRGASGAVLFAKAPDHARVLCKAFEEHRVEKVYLALVRGHAPEHEVIDHPIPGKEGGARVPAITEVWRRGIFERYSLVEARPRSGRLHQIRRHLKHLSCPLIGDVNYGKGEHNRLFRDVYGFGRLALHAVSLGFVHPGSEQPVTVHAPLTADFATLLATLGLAGTVATPVATPDGR